MSAVGVAGLVVVCLLTYAGIARGVYDALVALWAARLGGESRDLAEGLIAVLAAFWPIAMAVAGPALIFYAGYHLPEAYRWSRRRWGEPPIPEARVHRE